MLASDCRQVTYTSKAYTTFIIYNRTIARSQALETWCSSNMGLVKTGVIQWYLFFGAGAGCRTCCFAFTVSSEVVRLHYRDQYSIMSASTPSRLNVCSLTDPKSTNRWLEQLNEVDKCHDTNCCRDDMTLSSCNSRHPPPPKGKPAGGSGSNK